MSLDEAFRRVASEKEISILRPAASQLSAISKEYGYLVVYAFPGLDQALAASLLSRVLARLGVEHVVYFEPLLPSELDEPTLLLGYPASVAEEVKAKKPSALIGFGEKPQGIVSLAVSASNNSSITGLVAGVLSEITVVGYPLVYAVVSALWRGLDRGKKGEIEGLEASLLEVLVLENIVESFFSLKLARWKELPTEEALAATVLPLIPGLSGRPDEARRFLEADPRLKQLLGKTVDEAPDEAIATLGEKLYGILKERSRVPRRPTEIIGFNYYSERMPLRDLREAAAVLACYSSEGGLARVYPLLHSELQVAGDAYAVYNKLFPQLAGYVESMVSARPRAARVGGVEVTVLEKPPCMLLAEHELRRLGVVPPEAVAGFEADDGLLVSLESLLLRQGYRRLRELIASSCLEPLEGEAYGILRPGRC